MMMSLLLVVALVAPSLSNPLYQCPGGWKLLERTCFFVSSNTGPWNDGMDFCNKQGGTLATISNEFQHRALSAMLKDNAWIGLSDLDDNHNYGWADGSKYQYTRWQNEKHDVCVEMKKDAGFQWHDEQCVESKQFLCSAPAQRITTTTTTTTTTPAPHCHGWRRYGSSCYYVSNSAVNWGHARTVCNSLGAHLVSITSAGEDNFVRGMLSKATWMGMHRTGGHLAWVDGSPIGYTNWKWGEPNNLFWNEDCVEFRKLSNYKWNDINCGTNIGYVCEKPPH